MIDFIDSKEAEMLELLEKLVNIDSGSYTKTGVDRIGNILAERLADLDFSVKRIPQKELGDHVVGFKPGSDKRRILLIGHMDTVFAEGISAKRPFRIDSGRAYGPGVADMKGGLVCLLYALAALKERAPGVYERMSMDVVFNSDEEILSPSSRPLIESLARQAQAVCVFEPARPGGEYVIRRKGVGKYVMQITGKAAHAGTQPEDGRSAIEELAHKIVALHALTDMNTGTTVSVGIIRGGLRSNIIAEEAYAEVDLRICDDNEAVRMDKRIRSIAATSTVPDTRCEITGGIQFPPMLPSESSLKLFGQIQKAGRNLGLDLRGIATGGGSDGNYAARFAPTLDGMGPRGSGAHSDREFLEVRTLAERAKVAAMFLSGWPDVIGI